MEPFQLTATQLLPKFKDGSLTVEAYARSLLARIEARDASVKAWAYLDPAYVIEQAKKLDQIPPAERGPLHGVSVGVKDIIYTKDMPTRHNSPLYDPPAPNAPDASSVTLLRNAGALILGKTTTTEFAAVTRGGTGTMNPHSSPSDPHTPGGSSSGSGAAVGDFQVCLALGTQTGGSTIRPGSFNGIWAVKPTWGAVSREGQKMYAITLDTVGVYARCAEDLDLVLGEKGAFGLVDDDDSYEKGFEVKGAKFAYLKTNVWDDNIGPGTKAAMEKGAELLRNHGAIVEEIELPGPEFAKATQWHREVLHGEGKAAFRPEWSGGEKDRARMDPFLVGHVDNKEKISRKMQLDAFDGLAALRPRIDEIAGKYAAILTPSVPDEAPPGLESTGSACFNGIWTAFHTPVVNVPGFKGAKGLPIGLSLVAPRYNDRKLLAVAKSVGDIFETEGGWTRPVHN